MSFECCVVVEIGHGDVRGESAGAGDKGVVDVRGSGRIRVERVVGDEPLAWLAGECGRIEQNARQWIYLRSYDRSAAIIRLVVAVQKELLVTVG